MLRAQNLVKYFDVADSEKRFGRKTVRALRGVTLEALPRKTLGVVGESGSGKSTLAKVLALLVPPDSGSVFYNGKETRALSRAERANFRKDVQVVFQDPYASLNPRFRVGEALAEPFRIHPDRLEGKLEAAIDALLAQVGLPVDYKRRYPDELSGGERQRVAIARAIALKPKILICDEPVSSLDVLVQAQILNLFMTLQIELGLGYLFISHDLRVVRHLSDTVAVMHDGLVVEEGPAAQVLSRPAHAYTQNLVDSVRLDSLR